MSAPSISVVNASYNHAPYLRACIESALCQTLAPREVIVVDDGSKDSSREVIASFGREIVPILQENRGTYATLNVGFAQASGDWIAIHNSDDVWKPEKLERQAELIAAHPEVGLAHTGFQAIDGEDRPYAEPPPDVPEYHGPAVGEMLPTMLHLMPIVISSTLVSRQAYDRVGPFDERFHGSGDWEFCLRVSREYPFGYVSEPLTLFRRHAASASVDSSRIPKDWGGHDWQFLGLEAMPKAAEHLFRKAQAGAIPRGEAAHSLACLATIYSWDRQPHLARQVYHRAIQLQPARWQTYLRYGITFLPRPLRRKIR